MTPNQYYARSPLLFWTIVITGSRRYKADPTLLTKLSVPLQHFALCSLTSRTEVVEVIQSLLLLSLWPLPFNSAHKSMVHVFSGAAVNLAMQNGLHVLGVGQDFARVCLNPNEEEKATRARLWVYCVILAQRWVSIFWFKFVLSRL